MIRTLFLEKCLGCAFRVFLPPRRATQARGSARVAMLSAVALAATAAPSRQQFAVVFDGGSTGTRVYVYRYELPAPGTAPALPTLHAERSWNMKVSGAALASRN